MKLNPNPDHLRIPQWAEDDRPREKLLTKGRANLSDAELLAILIGTGTKALSAVDLAKQVLQQADLNLNNLARLSVKDLTRIKGIGEAKAISIVSALELGRRRKESVAPGRPRITNSIDVVEMMKQDLLDLNHEEFWIVILNRANYVLRKNKISSGGISGTVADPKLIFKSALDHRGSSIILVHNHPSGNLQPSQADITLTKTLKEAGKFLEIPVLDHIIVSDNSYFSFADEGMM
jgi:DNA repair protein RadC